MKTQATMEVHGPRQLQRAFRKRLAKELKEEAPEVAVTESQEGEVFRFHLDAPDGIPFPALVAISTQYPDCVAVVHWTQESAQGETTIQNGEVKEATRGIKGSGFAGHRPQHVLLAPDGSLVLAIALDIAPGGIVGYCATSNAETYFKLRGGVTNPELLTIGGEAMVWDEIWCESDANAIAANEPVGLTSNELRTLDQLAAAVRAEWLWYDHAPEEDTIVERQRYAKAQRPVRAINVKSHKTAARRNESGPETASNLASDQRWIVNLIESTWARA